MPRPHPLAIVVAVAMGLVLEGSEPQRVTPRFDNAARLESLLGGWYTARRQDAAALAAAQQAGAEGLRELSHELSTMQTQILRLESLAMRLIERADLAADEFDFGSEPGVGGPEEPSDTLPPDGHPHELSVEILTLAGQVEDRWRQLRVLEDLLKWRELDDSLRPEGRPVASGYVSSGFGPRSDPFTGRKALHKGIDFAGRRDTAVVAVAAGIVTWSGERSGYGRMVEIAHGNEHVTRYAHNARNLVEVGDVVTRGQTIARLGSTGRATGPNLHFEVLQNGQAVNPLPYIE